MSYQKVKVSRDKTTWEVEVRAEISAESMRVYREDALKELQKDAKIDGFRPGHAPIERIVQIYGEPALLRLACERAIREELPNMLAEEKLPVVETPRVQTDTPEAGKPLSFTARAGLAPEIELPDWKKLAHKHNEKKTEITVSDDEHQEAMTHMQREKARIEKMEGGEEPRAAAEAARAIAEHELPAIDDVFAKQVGYESAEKFSDAVRENIKQEKTLREKQTRRSAILDDIAEQATIHYPAALLEYELDDMEARLTSDLARMGATFEHYLSETKKTREEARAEWKEAADKRARVRLILSEIARQETVIADELLVASELEHAKKLYPQADPENLRASIAHAIRNEKVMELLEVQ